MNAARTWVWVGKRLLQRVKSWEGQFTEETSVHKRLLRPGDTLVYWQTGEHGGLCGVATVATTPASTQGRRPKPFKIERFRTIWIPRTSVETATGLRDFVRRCSIRNPNVRRVSDQEARAIASLIGRRPRRLTSPGRSVALSGQGFGSPEQNRRIELAAVNSATAILRRAGWRVRSVENERRGYDLDCSRRGARIHAEVKGVSGQKSDVILTSGELARLESDRLFRLCIVTRALTRPLLCLLEPQQVKDNFVISPIAYRAAHTGRSLTSACS